MTVPDADAGTPSAEGRMTRRTLLRRAAVVAVTLPALGTLLAACGGEDDAEPTPTSAGAQATPTSEDSEPTPTPVETEATATAGETEPTATADTSTEPTPTTGADSVTEIYGFPIDPPQYTDGTIVRAVEWSNSGWFLRLYNVFEIQESLVEYHPTTGEEVPLLAENWEASEDGLEWTFALRSGVTFHDGEPLTAEDVIFSIEMKNASTGDGVEPILSSTVTAVDDLTILVTIPEVSALTLNSIANYNIYAKHALPEIDPATMTDEDLLTHPANLGEDISGLIGTGPYRYAEIVLDQHEILERYDGYWGQKAGAKRLITRIYSSSDAVMLGLQAGEIDVSSTWTYISPAQLSTLEGAPVDVKEFPGGNMTVLYPNHWPERGGPFMDLAFRQAILHGTDRAALVEAAAFGYGEILDTTLVLPALFNEDEITATYPYDPDLAASLLDEAGWTMGSNGIRERDGSPLAFTCWYTSGDTLAETCVLILQEQWRALGIEMTPQPEAFVQISERRRAHDFDVVLSTFAWGILADQRWFYSCEMSGSSSKEELGYCNPELDEMMNRAVLTVDPDERRALTTEILNTAMSDLAIIPLIRPSGLMASSSRTHNFHPNIFNPTFNVETWWVEE